MYLESVLSKGLIKFLYMLTMFCCFSLSLLSQCIGLFQLLISLVYFLATKSEAMPLGKQPHLPSPPFNWSPAGFAYLGIFVTPCFDQMFKANFAPLFDKIKQDLEHWTNLPISWLGRISLLKMNILPRLLYPMRMIPVLFPYKLIQKIKGWFSSFIWSKKKVLIKMSTLQLSNHMGGLDLPDLKKISVEFTFTMHPRMGM